MFRIMSNLPSDHTFGQLEGCYLYFDTKKKKWTRSGNRGGTSSILYLTEPPPLFIYFSSVCQRKIINCSCVGMTSWESVRFAYGALGTLAHIAPIGPLACALANALLTSLQKSSMQRHGGIITVCRCIGRIWIRGVQVAKKVHSHWHKWTMTNIQ